MEFKSILDKKNSPSQVRRSVPTFMIDINADQIVEKICKGKEDELRFLFHYFPEDEESEAYRRGVYQDMKKPRVQEVLRDFKLEMDEFHTVEIQKDTVMSPLQKKIWHLELSRVYIRVYSHLQEMLATLYLESEGMLAFRSYLNEIIAGERFQKLKEETLGIKEELQAFRVTVHYENDRMILADWSEGVEDEYEQFLLETNPNHQSEIKNLFGTEKDFTAIERDLVEILIKKKPEFFKKVDAFYEAWKEFWEEPLLLFAKEIDYYLVTVFFQQEMQEKGYDFCVPEATNEKGEFQVEGVYDLALALAKGDTQEIISNDFEYTNEEQFFVVTGPNQGGKTTFARSLGQVLFFFKMGFDVPAKLAKIPHFDVVMTHFSVEESVETGRGKLQEELVRLSPMIRQEAKNAYVIINELFTTAANYDAIEMGTRTLRTFLDRGYYGIYVTHLGELSTVDSKVVSLMAGLDDTGKQNFKIERRAAMDLPCAINQVNKHGLSYEQVKERLSCL